MKLDDKAADAPNKSLQQCVRLETLDDLVEIVKEALILRRNISRISFTVGISPLCDGCQILVIRTCDQPGYTATCYRNSNKCCSLLTLN